MKSINIGIVNLVVSKKLKDAYFSNTLIEESKQLTNSFFNLVKNSPILQLEFKVFSNIENKHIENDLIATRYIDNNIKLFEVYTLDELEREHQKLKLFLTEDVQVDDNKVQLYIAVGNLIKESHDLNAVLTRVFSCLAVPVNLVAKIGEQLIILRHFVWTAA